MHVNSARECLGLGRQCDLGLDWGRLGILVSDTISGGLHSVTFLEQGAREPAWAGAKRLVLEAFESVSWVEGSDGWRGGCLPGGGPLEVYTPISPLRGYVDDLGRGYLSKGSLGLSVSNGHYMRCGWWRLRASPGVGGEVTSAEAAGRAGEAQGRMGVGVTEAPQRASVAGGRTKAARPAEGPQKKITDCFRPRGSMR